MAPLVLPAIAILPFLRIASGHGGGEHRVVARQAPSAPASSASGPASATTPVMASVAPTSYTFSLQATNPTAVPLTSITASQASLETLPLKATPAAGETPTFIPNAPGLPDASLIVSTDYPAWDQPPPIDSPEVLQWKNEVANSGITIPDLTTTKEGGCAANPTIASDASRCWWTCSGCVREQDITDCPNKMQWGLTYDDGPGFYTTKLLEYLDEQKLKSTFFVVGSRAVQFPHVLQAQYMGEHQIAVHTWSHRPLTTQTNDEIIAELGWTKKIIKDVLGLTPNMMRPPFGDIDDRVRAISLAMGLTPVIWTRTGPASTFDTDDFSIHSGVTPVSKVLQNWENILAQAEGLDHGFIVLEHDLFQESVEVATGYILPDALAHNPPFEIQPVVQCLGRKMADAYIETNNNKTYPSATGSSSESHSAQSDDGSGSEKAFQLTLGMGGSLLVSASGLAVGLLAGLNL